MCLYISRKKPLVAKKDIVVYKYVRKQRGHYVTACQNYPIQTNKVLTASHSGEDIVDNNYGKYSIKGGAIHACTSSYDIVFNLSGTVCLKAYIKEGTEFWIQNDFGQVAARSLYITDEVVTDKQDTNIIELCKILMEDAPTNKYGVRIGDVLLSDKTYVSPLSDFDKTKVIGYVACFNPKDDSPIHISLKNEYLPFLSNIFYHNYCNFDIDNHISEDFDGYKHTYNIANAKDYKSELFKVIDYCINYKSEGTNKGDWHLGSTGEMIAIAKNLIFINSAIKLVGIGEIMSLYWYWTSSHFGDGQFFGSWCVYLSNSSSYDYYNLGSKGQVRPLLAFNKQSEHSSYIKRQYNKLLKSITNVRNKG